MKIRCDVCDKVEASVFCCADEAALCDGCDRHVHHANKLANKHKRFSLLHPPFKESPLCDICRERRAILFCQEDRAILCRECDLRIHRANEHTQNHNRFILTGVKLSSTSSFYPNSSSSNCTYSNSPIKNTDFRHAQTSTKRPRTVSNQIFNSPSYESMLPSVTLTTSSSMVEEKQISDSRSYSTSSISEYLETLPGWCLDDFLDPSSVSNGFYM